MTTRLIEAAENQYRAQLLDAADAAFAEEQRLYDLVPWMGADLQRPLCPCCGSPIYPKETAEYKTWAAANAATEQAALAAVLGEAIGVPDAALRWHLWPSGLEMSVRHHAEAEERAARREAI